MSKPVNVVCPHCLKEINPLPAMPLFSLDDARAVLLVPTRGAMWTLLWRHKGILDTPRYAFDAGNRRQRMLTASEIQRLKDCRRLSTKGVMRWLAFDQ
jgi:hypothetical protein